MKLATVPLLALFTLAPFPVLADRPSNISICDYYSTTILGSNTIANEKLLITLLINTVVLGTYTTPNNSIPVHGFAAPGVYNGTEVALLAYFTGELLSTNEGGPAGVSKFFLDDGGAGPLLHNMSSNGNVSSVQYHVLNNIYEFFRYPCSNALFKAVPSSQNTRAGQACLKFIIYQMDFFIQQCSDSAASLGFSPQDVLALYLLLQQFNTRCSAPFTVPSLLETAPVLNAVCLNDDCRLDGGKGADCALYPKSVKVLNATEVALGTNGNGTTNGTATATARLPAKTAASDGILNRGMGEIFWSIIVIGMGLTWASL